MKKIIFKISMELIKFSKIIRKVMPWKLILVFLSLNFIFIKGDVVDDLLNPLLETLALLAKSKSAGKKKEKLKRLFIPCFRDNCGWLINSELDDAFFIHIINSQRVSVQYCFFNPIEEVDRDDEFLLKDLAKYSENDSNAYQKIQKAYTYINYLKLNWNFILSEW